MMTKLEQVQVCLPREIMGKTHPNVTPLLSHIYSYPNVTFVNCNILRLMPELRGKLSTTYAKGFARIALSKMDKLSVDAFKRF